MPDTTTIESRIASLADGGDAHVISGTAIAAGDVTRGLSGDLKVWRESALRAAAKTLQGQPINVLHSEQDVGRVTAAGFEDGAVVYEARLDDSRLAQQVDAGQLEVSIEARHAAGETVDTPRGEAMAATNIRFTGLSLLQRGAAPSATASPGEAAALAEVNGTEIDLSPPEAVVNAAEAALEAKERLSDEIGDCGTGVGEDRAEQIIEGDLAPEDFVGGGDHTAIPDYLDSHSEDVAGIDEPPTQWDDETWTDGCGPVQYALWGGTATGTGLEWAESTEAEIQAAMDEESASVVAQLRDVAGVSFTGTDTGSLDESRLDADEHDLGDHYLYGSGEDKEDFSYPVVDADGDLRRGNVDAAWELGCRGQCDDADAHDRRLMQLAAAFDTPPAWAVDDEENARMMDAERLAETPRDEAAAGDSDAADRGADSAASDTTTSMTDDSDTPDDGHDVEALLERVDEKEMRIDDLQAELSARENEIEAVKRAYASVLADKDSAFDEDDLVEHFDLATLAGKVDDLKAALAERVDPEPDVQTGSGDTPDEEADLAPEQREEVAALEERADRWEQRGNEEAAERLRERAAAIKTGDA